jgi:hypothetical protein
LFCNFSGKSKEKDQNMEQNSSEIKYGPLAGLDYTKLITLTDLENALKSDSLTPAQRQAIEDRIELVADVLFGGPKSPKNFPPPGDGLE